MVSRRGFLREFSGGVVATGALARSGASVAAWEGGQVIAPTLSIANLKPSGQLDEAYWWKVRSQFNILDGMTFMNNGTEGPVPRVVLEANERFFREIAENPSDNYRREEIDQVRALVAGFVGADAGEIALTRSTTEGMNIFSHGLDWKAGDEVIYCTHEHGGGIGVLTTLTKRVGIKPVLVEIPSPPPSIDHIVSLYEKAITPRTKVIMVSHMTYVTGLVTPVKELADLAHRRGLLISVDGAHPLGMMDLNLKALNVDHYAAAGQKWLMCGTGTGVCYIKREVQERIWPLMGPPGDPKDGAKKYEAIGQRDVPSVLGMTAAVELQKAIGKANIEARVRFLSGRFRAGLKTMPGVKMWTSEDPAFAAGLTLFSVRDIPMANVQQAILSRDRIYIRTMTTGNLNACRAATHIYNMPAEVDHLLDSIRHVAENSSRYMTVAAH
ncbi:MAG: aminotransferase class V-fold PLP-dependent enzyme [Acidobacteria bacterium]|nr:aminotransferase class V-fold PLP-dependent enzyme [Acidobacteriota bacterium]